MQYDISASYISASHISASHISASRLVRLAPLHVYYDRIIRGVQYYLIEERLLVDFASSHENPICVHFFSVDCFYNDVSLL